MCQIENGTLFRTIDYPVIRVGRNCDETKKDKKLLKYNSKRTKDLLR